MSTIVIEPPDPLLVPSDVPGDHGAADPVVAAYIAAATEEIDGPQGWLGRALGVQTLEYRAEGFPCGDFRLPCPPIVEIEAITYVDTAGMEHTLDVADVVVDRFTGALRLAGSQWPCVIEQPASVRIRYVAGYDGISPDSGGTGELPQRVKQAIMLNVLMLQATGSASQDLKVEDVDGVGRREWFTSRADSSTITKAANSLLSGLRVYR